MIFKCQYATIVSVKCNPFHHTYHYILQFDKNLFSKMHFSIERNFMKKNYTVYCGYRTYHCRCFIYGIRKYH